MDTVKISRGQTHMIAHRGLSGLEKENTAAAFVAAANRSYYGIETDVHITSDGRFILHHDATVRDPAGASYRIAKTPFDTLRRICFAQDGVVRADLRMPLLEEYLMICRKYGKVAVVELKEAWSTSELERILQAVGQMKMLSATVFISFAWENVVSLRALSPNVAIQFLWDAPIDEKLVERLREYHFGLDVAYRRLNAENTALLQNNGIEINAWTCDDPKRAEQLAIWGVNEITTNILE